MTIDWQERALNAEAEVEGLEATRAGDDLAIESLRAEIERLRAEWEADRADRQEAYSSVTVEMDRLRAALSDAIDLAEEGWGYDSGYFRQKWDVENRIAALRSVLAPL